MLLTFMECGESLIPEYPLSRGPDMWLSLQASMKMSALWLKVNFFGVANLMWILPELINTYFINEDVARLLPRSSLRYRELTCDVNEPSNKQKAWQPVRSGKTVRLGSVGGAGYLYSNP